MLEGLERRLLMAAISLVKGQLNIIGTSGADDIEISQSGSVITINDGGAITTINRPVIHVVLQGKAGNDRLIVRDSILVDVNLDAGDGDDVARGGGGPDRVAGGKGNDVVNGGLGTDIIAGGDGSDLVTYGDRAADAGTPGAAITLDGLANDGAAGENDLVRNDTEHAEGTEGDDTLVGSGGANVLRGLRGHDVIDGGDGNDTASGGAGNDVICGGSGNDQLFGDAGNDLFVNDDGQADHIFGGDDLDFVQREVGSIDVVAADVESRFDETEEAPTNGVDTPDEVTSGAPLVTQAGEITLLASGLAGGVLTVSGTSGADAIEIHQVGGATGTIEVRRNGVLESTHVASKVDSVVVDVGGGDDFVRLETSTGTNSLLKPSLILGAAGNDTLRGGGGADNISGGIGNDSCLGGGNNDTLSGGDGDDVLNGGAPNLTGSDGRDVFVGGAGSGDYVDYSVRNVPLTLRLDDVANDGQTGSTESENLPGDVENILGGKQADLITGNSLVNVLSGGGGADTLKGGSGNDQLIASFTGDALVDFVFGNAGNDYLFIQDGKLDSHSGVVGTDFFSPDGGDVTVADQL